MLNWINKKEKAIPYDTLVLLKGVETWANPYYKNGEPQESIEYGLAFNNAYPPIECLYIFGTSSFTEKRNKLGDILWTHWIEIEC